jgi:hypothetical protein
MIQVSFHVSTGGYKSNSVNTSNTNRNFHLAIRVMTPSARDSPQISTSEESTTKT